MRSSEKTEQIGAALAAAQAEFRAVPKNGQNTYDKYSYAKLEDYVKVSMPILAKHHISILTSVDQTETLEVRLSSKGNKEYGVRVKCSIRLLHESGQWVEADVWGEGQDRSDKAIYKAITGARKYGIAAMLGLATTDDPEADEESDREPQRQTNRQRNGAAKPAQDPGDVIASDAEVAEILGLLKEVKIPAETLASWFQKANASGFEEMTSQDVQKCIQYVRGKLTKTAA